MAAPLAFCRLDAIKLREVTVTPAIVAFAAVRRHGTLLLDVGFTSRATTCHKFSVCSSRACMLECLCRAWTFTHHLDTNCLRAPSLFDAPTGTQPAQRYGGLPAFCWWVLFCLGATLVAAVRAW